MNSAIPLHPVDYANYTRLGVGPSEMEIRLAPSANQTLPGPQATSCACDRYYHGLPQGLAQFL